MSERPENVDVELLAAAQGGDQQAWAQLVERYQPLINKISRRHRLSSWDAEDVSQHVWAQLVDQAARLREPRALPGWIATTTARRCCHVLQKRNRSICVDPLDGPGLDSAGNTAPWSESERSGVEDGLLRTELRQAVRTGLADLTSDQQALLLLVVADPPVPYAEISRRLGMPIGSIGPTRARLLQRLRRSVAVQVLMADAPMEIAKAA